MPESFRLAALLGVVALPLALAGMDELAILPMDHPAIQYIQAPLHDRVSALQQRLAQGAVHLSHHQESGYLESLLQALEVAPSSQVLVFSKTSFQAPKIGPRMPRAIYHSDDVAVGFVRGGDVLEIAAVDPQQGVVFYTLDQGESSRPAITRRGECVQCHVGAATLGVPGLVVRSVHVDRSGAALLSAPAFVTDHRSPLKQRWGGWYVTGAHGGQLHMGNQTVEDRDDPELDLSQGANVSDLHRYFDPYAYLQPSSDIVSLMILEHQTRMTNLITRLGWETRMGLEEARLAATAEVLVSYMLFADETLLTAPIKGSQAYAAEFMARGPRDRRGRSLRQLDMTARMFRYPCSFLIYSAQFDGLPASAKDRVYRRLYDILSGHERSAAYARFSQDDRRAVFEILQDTKKDLPSCWKTEACSDAAVHGAP
jgi:hypothetical protein